MKSTIFQTRSILIASVAALALVFGGGCAGLEQQENAGSFSSVQPVLETNCVHCHGKNRLANMPAFTDTRALGKLIGKSNWIVPGHPEQSRFFQVVMLTDEQPGAMPPTGHAISPPEVATLRAWIAAGAPLPEGAPVVLSPRGPGQRSR